MRKPEWLAWLALVVGLGAPILRAEVPRAVPSGSLPPDARLGPLKDLDGYFPMAVPESAEAWSARAEYVRRQALVALGLWPLPTRTPLRAVIHTPIDRGEYTVEHVYFESYPGHFVTGNLYRPKGRQGKRPGVLCPHGHWANGRFHDHGPDEVQRQIAKGGERFERGGRHPLQARCVHLARLGCVVFHYDMVGYADSQQISFDVAHRYGQPRPHMETAENWGFFSTQAELRLQTIMGLQAWNSIRALDFLSQLEDVDPARIGVTGASGGGTQTFILCAVDPRPAVAFPAVMVSTAMQGGCTCENCNYLRIGTGNIELAGLFAPKPLAMTGADDWTREIETKGLPELKRLYALLGAPERVMAAPLLQFEHNYNYVSRSVMYAWFNQYLGLGYDPVPEEQDYQPLSAEELTVWNAEHPRPPSGDEEERRLLRVMTADAQRQLAALLPIDPTTLAAYREVVAPAIDVLVGRRLPPAGAVEFEKTGESDCGSYLQVVGLLRYKAAGEALPAVFLHPKQWNGEVVVWLDVEGKQGLFDPAGQPREAVAAVVASGRSVASLDLLYQGEFLPDGQPLSQTRKVENPREYAGYTFGYNYPLFAQRVHDVLSMLSFVRHHELQPRRVHLVAARGAAHWAAVAAAQAPDAVDVLVLDTQGFRFVQATGYRDPNFWPGSVKYGDLEGILALLAPKRVWLAGEPTVPRLVQAAYDAAGMPQAIGLADLAQAGAVVNYLAGEVAQP
jgi:dienelactone hydrolase